MPAPPGPALRRRTAVAALAAGAVAGCDAAPGSDPRAGRTPSPVSTATEDPDAALVDRAALETAALLSLATTLHRRRASADTAAPFVALHRAHLRALSADDVSNPAPVPVGRDAVGELLDRERVAARRLAGWSGRARSGALARLLASMSAGLEAHVAAADGTGARPR